VNTFWPAGHSLFGDMLFPGFALPGDFSSPLQTDSARDGNRASPMRSMAYDVRLAGAPSSDRLVDDLVERLRAGQIAAVGEAYDLHHEHVRRFARRLVGDEDAAEDLVHETFLTLPKAIQRFEGRSALRTFLVSIAVNHCKHHVRSAVRRRSAMNRAGEEPSFSGVSSGEDSPERTMERRQLASVLTRCLDKLSVEHRVTFVLCEVEERNSREVAEVLGVPEGTVRTRLMHAKKKLRGFISQEGLS
jgi:RNA polymerase sigma-70 factor (ECF subfamily)